MKVLAIHPIINPMRVYWFNEMNTFFKKKDIHFEALFLSPTDKNRFWKKNNKITFKHSTLKNLAIRIGKKDLYTFFINPDILKFLNKTNPDLIICCQYDHLTAYITNIWARAHHKKFLFFAESTIYENSWRRTLFMPLVKYLLKHTDYFWAGGTRAKEYLINLGVNEKKIEIFYNSVDLQLFSKKSKLFKRNKTEFKKKIGANTDKVILFVGQLIERKGIYELVEGFDKFRKFYPDSTLLFVGTGKERRSLEEYISNKNIQNIIIVGFVEYQELYKYYSISDLLILPSREEVWGLVINEGEASGLPIITTNVTGASVDLVENNKNGLIIKPNCSICICQALTMVFKKRMEVHNTSQKIVQKTDIPFMLSNSYFLKKICSFQ